jgi:hypothetical protein
MRRAIEQPFKLLKIKADRSQDVAANSVSTSTASICTCRMKSLELLETNQIQQQNQQIVGNESGESSKAVVNDEIVEEKDTISFKNLRKLKQLRLESCVNVTNAGLFFGLNLGEIEELDIKLCTNINGEFVYGLLEEAYENGGILFNKLRVLNVNQCLGFHEESLLFIVEQAPNLRELSVSTLPCVTDKLIDQLLRLKRLLSLFDVSFCPNVSEAAVERYETFLFNEFGSREFLLDKRFVSK